MAVPLTSLQVGGGLSAESSPYRIRLPPPHPPTLPPRVPPQAHSLGGIQPAVGSRIRPSTSHPSSALDGPQSFRPALNRSGPSSPGPQHSDPQPAPPHCRQPSKFDQVVLLSQPCPRLRGVPAPRLPASFLPQTPAHTHLQPQSPQLHARSGKTPRPVQRLQARWRWGRAGVGAANPTPGPGPAARGVLPAGQAHGPRRPGRAQVEHLPGSRPFAVGAQPRTAAPAPGTER